MLTIRLRRTGKKGQPSYRIVVADQRAPIYGKYLEMVGNFNPHSKAVVLDNQKTLDWLNKGAKPTNTVAKILTKQGLEHKSIVIKKFRAISQKELEIQKAKEEKEKADEQAKRQAQKEAFEKQIEQEKAEKPSSEDKLQEAAAETIQEDKAETIKKAEAKESQETKEDGTKVEEAKSQEKPPEDKKS